MTKVTADDITTLLAAARAMQPGAEAALAENAFFKALLDATVYAHVPIEGAPPGRMRFIQFVHTRKRTDVLPFSDLAQAEPPEKGCLHCRHVPGVACSNSPAARR